MKIESFDGANRFLSNFCTVFIYYEGQHYSSTEHAYQAAKTLDLDMRRVIANLPQAAQAKRAGQKVAKRPDWEQVKDQVMLDVCRLKFQVPVFKQALLATKDLEIVEGNTWGDVYWGVCDGVGQNKLGKILMQIRKELQDAERA